MILNTIADLQALSTIPSDNHGHVLGYNTPADGGGGDFYWDASSIEDENYGTVFESPSIATGPSNPGRWRRYYSESVNLKWFGAVGDGTTNDSPAFQKMVDFCEKTGIKDAIIAFGDFYLEESVHVKIGAVKFIGQGAYQREDSWTQWANPQIYPGYDDPADFNQHIAYKGANLIVKNGISGIVYDASVSESVYWKGVGFRTKDGRQPGNTYAIDFKAEFWGPTWPFIVQECFFMGFNRVFNFDGGGQTYNIASINISYCAFKQNDEVIYQGFYIYVDANTEIHTRYSCWGLNFQNNKCHDNSRIIYGFYAKDLVTISDNNMEGNIPYSDGTLPNYVIDIEINYCSVKIHGNHFEGQASDCVSISSLQKNANDIYKGVDTNTSHYVDIYGNNFDGVQPLFKPFTLTGCVIKINERTPIHVHACEILENGNSPVYMTPYALENGTIIKFSDQRWLSSNFVKGINSYGITNNSNEQSFLENGEQFIRTTRDAFGLGSAHYFNGDVKYCVSVYKSRSNLPRIVTHSAICSFRKDGVVLNPNYNSSYGIGGPPRGESLIVCVFPSDGLFTDTSSNSFSVGLSSQVGSSEPIEFSSSTFMYTTKESNPLIVPVFEHSDAISEIGTFEKGQTWFNGSVTRIAATSGTVGTLSPQVIIEQIVDDKIRLNYAYFIAQGQFVEIDNIVYRIIELIEVPASGQQSTFWIKLDTVLPSNVNVGDEIIFHTPTFTNLDSAPDTAFLRNPQGGDYTVSRPVFFTPSSTNFDNLLTSGAFFDANNTSGTSPFGDRYGIFYNAYSSVDSGYGFQFGADTHYASIDGDKFVYRSKVGLNWQPWRQVASREWSNQAFIQNQNASSQSANMWIDGRVVADHYTWLDGSTFRLDPSITSVNLYTSSSLAQNLKAGGLTISNNYTDNAPINGIFSKGTIKSGVAAGSIGIDLTTTNARAEMRVIGNSLNSSDNDMYLGFASGLASALHLYSNNEETLTITNEQVGIGTTTPAQKLDVNGTIRQANATSAMLKANSSGDIVAATAGTDYVAPGYLDAGTYTPTVTAISGITDVYVVESFTYTKIGSVVHVAGTIKVSPDPYINPLRAMNVSLPIASDVTVEYDIAGVANGRNDNDQIIQGATICGDPINDNALVVYEASDEVKLYLQFDYTIQ